MRHLDGAPWFEGYLREVAAEQRLVASVTSEVGTGGDMGRSIAAVDARPTTASRTLREAGADRVSYGAYADDLLTTLRRAPDAEPGDQVVGADPQGPAHARADRHVGPARDARHVLARLRRPRRVPGRAGPADAVLDASPPSRWCRSRTSSGRTSGSGIATDAFDRARAFVRASAKRKPGAAAADRRTASRSS